MPNVLIVDDSPALACGVAAVLKSAGYHARTVFSGLDALAFLKRYPVDLVVLDLRMPGMSGLDVLQALRDSPDPSGSPGVPPFPPIVVFSANDRMCDEALRLGAVGFVSKCDTDALIPLVRQHAPLGVA